MSNSQSWEFQSIPIDFEVFKALTARLKSSEDTYNSVLRRELKLGIESLTSERIEHGRPWNIDGVSLPHGTELRARHKGETHFGRVEDGALVVRGKRYASPSPAAIAITGTSINGWKFWEYRRFGSTGWSIIDGLRKK
jgi:hypothetical protein